MTQDKPTERHNLLVVVIGTMDVMLFLEAFFGGVIMKLSLATAFVCILYPMEETCLWDRKVKLKPKTSVREKECTRSGFNNASSSILFNIYTVKTLNLFNIIIIFHF